MACVYVNNYETLTQQRREMDNIIPTEFIAEILNGILATNRPPSMITWEVPLPELLLFVERVTTKARVEYHTAMVALVLLSRLKKRLPKNAYGEYGTCHRLFLSAILVASKDSTQNRPYPNNPSPPPSQEKLPLSSAALLIENRDQSSPPDFISSSSSSSSSDEEEGEGEDSDSKDDDDTNCKLAEISDIFTVREVNMMEREFRRLLGGQIYVDENDVKKFMENHKYALGYC